MNAELLGLACELISIPTVTDKKENLNKIIDTVSNKIVSSLSLVIEKIEHNGYPSIIVKNFEGKNADVIMIGHLDVVASNDVDQFMPKIVGDKLYGRGAADMKSQDAAMILAMNEYLKYGGIKKVALMLTTDEEMSGADGAGEIVKSGYTGSLVIVPDGGDFNTIVTKQKGLFWITLHVTGKPSHAARPEEGINAIDKAIDICNQIKQSILSKNTYLDDRNTTIALTKIASGDNSRNTIPDDVSVTIDIRNVENLPLNDIKSNIDDIVKSNNATYTIDYSGFPLNTDENDDLVQLYKNLFMKKYNSNVSFGKEVAGCDGNFFSEKGMQVVVHQPNTFNIHDKDEYIDIPSLEKYYEFLCEYLKSLN